MCSNIFNFQFVCFIDLKIHVFVSTSQKAARQNRVWDKLELGLHEDLIFVVFRCTKRFSFGLQV